MRPPCEETARLAMAVVNHLPGRVTLSTANMNHFPAWLCFFAATVLCVPMQARAMWENTNDQPTFSEPVDYDGELTGAQYVVVGDILNRGIDDLIVTHGQDNNGHVSLLLGMGDGTFGPPQIVFSGTLSDQPKRAEVADVNGDGNLDLVMATTSDNEGAFLTALGDGKGHFRMASQTPTSGGPFVLGRFGPDSLPDIFMQVPYALPATIYRSNGMGGFTTTQLPYGGGAGGFVAIDVNHDGLLDLVGIGQSPFLFYPERLQTLFGTGDSRFFESPRYTLPSLEESQSTGNNTGVTAAVGDFRGSGNADLVVFGADFQYGITVVGSIYLGHPDGLYDPPLLLPIQGPERGFGIAGSGAGIGDFNGDGIPDICLTASPLNQASHTYILTGRGDGTFPVERQALLPVLPLYPHVVVVDLNGDGRPDIILSDQTSGSGVWILLNTTPSEAGRL